MERRVTCCSAATGIVGLHDYARVIIERVTTRDDIAIGKKSENLTQISRRCEVLAAVALGLYRLRR